MDFIVSESPFLQIPSSQIFMKLSLNIGTHGKIECHKISHHKAILSDCNLAEGGAAESKSSMVSSPWSLTSKEDNKVKHQQICCLPQQLDLRQTDPNWKYREGVSDSPRKQCLTCIVGADAPEVGTPGVMTATQQKCRQPLARTGPCWMVPFFDGVLQILQFSGPMISGRHF